MNEVAKNLKTQEPELWNNINYTFITKDNTIDSTERNNYLKAIAGDDGLSPDDVRRLKWRFNDNKETPYVRSADDFQSRMEDRSVLDSPSGKYLKSFLGEHSNFGDQTGYVRDQLFTRFAGDDGKLSNKEAIGLSQYLEGRVTWDSNELIGRQDPVDFWGALYDSGARPKMAAVKELIDDPTVIDRMPGRSFQGDCTFYGEISGERKHRDAYMDDEGGFLD